MRLPCECPGVLIEEYADMSRKDWFDKFQGLIAYDFVLRQEPEPVPVMWTPEMSAEKEHYGRMMGPKHASIYTKPAQPSTKARKAARRRAKAGRKASR